jgi:hypothetical protein
MRITLEGQWFWAHFYSSKNVLGTIAELENSVARFRLERFVKEICVQIIPGSSTKVGGLQMDDFYLYVGISGGSQAGHLPERLRDVPPFRGAQFITVPSDQILHVLKEWRTRTEGKVLYRAPDIVFDSPLGPVPETILERSDNDILIDTDRFDRLFLWMSSQGAGDYRKFADLCKSLFPEPGNVKPSMVRKNLRLLGHIAEAPDGLRWKVLPPMLVPIHGRASNATYALVGARDKSLWARLRTAFEAQGGEAHSVPQSRGDGPSTWTFVVRNRTLAKMISSQLAIPICRNLDTCLEAMPTLPEFARTLPSVNIAEMHHYEVRYFNGNSFETTGFQRVTGMYELWTLPDRNGNGTRERTQ